jgi:hypothetical protein
MDREYPSVLHRDENFVDTNPKFDAWKDDKKENVPVVARNEWAGNYRCTRRSWARCHCSLVCVESAALRISAPTRDERSDPENRNRRMSSNIRNGAIRLANAYLGEKRSVHPT